MHAAYSHGWDGAPAEPEEMRAPSTGVFISMPLADWPLASK